MEKDIRAREMSCGALDECFRCVLPHRRGCRSRWLNASDVVCAYATTAVSSVWVCGA